MRWALITQLLLLAGTQQPASREYLPMQQAPNRFRAMFATTKGSFVIAVEREWSPLGADRLWTLLNEGHYNGARFSRVIPGFVVQFGLSADPQENRRWARRSLPDEPATQDNRLGRVAFATSGPNSRSTQLYINLADNRWLDGLRNEYLVPIGRVEDGMEVGCHTSPRPHSRRCTSASGQMTSAAAAAAATGRHPPAQVLSKLYGGYGDTVDQAQLAAGGEAYAAKAHPLLDRVLMAFPVEHGHRHAPLELLERTHASHRSLVRRALHAAARPVPTTEPSRGGGAGAPVRSGGERAREAGGAAGRGGPPRSRRRGCPRQPAGRQPHGGAGGGRRVHAGTGGGAAFAGRDRRPRRAHEWQCRGPEAQGGHWW